MQNTFLFISAENDGIPFCKAGGMGDVVRDVPRQLAENNDVVNIITPAYGRLHYSGKLVKEIAFEYRGIVQYANIYEVPGKKENKNIKHYVLEHPEIKSGDISHIYFNDPDQPFYTDACMFSLFCTAVAQAICEGFFEKLNTIHLHDWHTSLMLFLKAYHPSFKKLNQFRFVYSIHNLAIQGIRPFDNNYSSLKAFYPNVNIDYDALKDHRYQDCINLMALGIRLADAVHTVSPSYKEEILLESHHPHFFGGESLEADLQNAQKQRRLYGILNGCNYSNYRPAKRGMLYKHILHSIFKWLQEEGKERNSDFFAHTGDKVFELTQSKPKFICSSVARLTDQKFLFFKDSPSVLYHILDKLKEVDGVYILLGTGGEDYEAFFKSVSYQYHNFLFINNQNEYVVDSIYLESHLYIMPSVFEPCGISQMLALRSGTPCLVHNIGGLKDTIEHEKTGFVFDGENFEQKSEDFKLKFNLAIDIYFNQKSKWAAMVRAAKKQRFTWQKSIEEYYTQLYAISRENRGLDTNKTSVAKSKETVEN